MPNPTTPRRTGQPRATPRRVWLVAVVLTGTLTTVAGCDSGGAAAGDLAVVTGPTNPREICVSAEHGPDYTIGVADARNTGDAPVTVTNAELANTKGMRATDVDLILIGPRATFGEFGVWNDYPPQIGRRERALQDLWNARTPAVGATLPPRDDVTLNFVIHLTGSAGATGGPLVVTYRDADGDSGEWRTNVTYAIRGRC